MFGESTALDDEGKDLGNGVTVGKGVGDEAIGAGQEEEEEGKC